MAHPRLVKVAAVQAAPVAFDLPATLTKVHQLVSEAAQHGAQLVVLPEAFVSAYPRHWGFAIGSRSESQREWYARYVNSSVMVPDDALGTDWLAAHPDLDASQGGAGSGAVADFWAFGRLCEAARTSRIYLSIGIIERSSIGSTLWCTNLVISPAGVLLSKHRKLQPTAAERVVWSQGESSYPTTTSSRPGNLPAGALAHGAPSLGRGGVAAQAGALMCSVGRDGDAFEDGRGSAERGRGDNMPVVRTSIGRIGGLICWENFMPLARYVLYKKGVEIYTAPTADARPTWLPVMQHIAQEGRCFVISANQYHTSKDFPADYPANISSPAAQASAHGGGDSVDKGEVWSRGGSSIVGPLGQVLAGPLWDEEGILYAELDLDQIHGAKLDFDPVGHYGREELLLNLLQDLA